MRNPAKDWETEKLAAELVDAALKVHRTLGPGLLETVYEACLCQELYLRKIPFKRQVSVPIIYEGVTLDAGLRLDVVVADRIVVEIKAVERLIPLFDAQVLTYLKLTGMELGLLINFNVRLLRDGLRRIVLTPGGVMTRAGLNAMTPWPDEAEEPDSERSRSDRF